MYANTPIQGVCVGGTGSTPAFYVDSSNCILHVTLTEMRSLALHPEALIHVQQSRPEAERFGCVQMFAVCKDLLSAGLDAQRERERTALSAPCCEPGLFGWFCSSVRREWRGYQVRGATKVGEGEEEPAALSAAGVGCLPASFQRRVGQSLTYPCPGSLFILPNGAADALQN